MNYGSSGASIGAERVQSGLARYFGGPQVTDR